MNLVNITPQEIGGYTVQTVDARELYEALEVGRDFTTWMKGRIDQYGFMENVDWIFTKFGEKSGRGRPASGYRVSIGMAKELAMVENNQRGREIRRYFIECEQMLREGEQLYKHVPIEIPDEVSVTKQLKLCLSAAEVLGIEIEQARRLAVRRVGQLYGVDLSFLLEDEDEEGPPRLCADEPEDVPMRASDIAKQFGCSTQRLNWILRDAGLQKRHRYGWVVTEKGAPLCATSLKGEDDFAFSPNLKWYKRALISAIAQ